MKKIRYYIQKLLGRTKYQLGQKKYNMGKRSYIAENSKITCKDTVVGKFCSIAGECNIGFGKKHLNYLTTSGFINTEQDERLFGDLIIPQECVIKSIDRQPVKIGNDVWIGFRVCIMDGITIGDGAVIGTNSVVTHDVPPYAVVAGSPARVIKYRFTPEIIEKLLELRWWDYPEDFIVKLPFDNIEKCIELLDNNKDLLEKKDVKK